MATYTCAICGMSVVTYCATCKAELVDALNDGEDGVRLRRSACPNGHGHIEAPRCCERTMSCPGSPRSLRSAHS